MPTLVRIEAVQFLCCQSTSLQ